MDGHGTEGRWAGPPRNEWDTEEPGPNTKRPRLEKQEEDVVDLLDEAEALELVEFDPKVKPLGTWEPPQAICTFLEKHINRSLRA